MLWLCLYFANLAIELRGPEEDLPIAVTDRRQSRRIVIAANSHSRNLGIVVGQDATTALAREPSLRLLDRALPSERRALKSLAAWGLQFSSDVTIDEARWLLWLEVGGSLRYFDDLARLLHRVSEGLSTLGYCAQRGVAPTLEAAAAS